jgi:hypothetical protein
MFWTSTTTLAVMASVGVALLALPPLLLVLLILGVKVTTKGTAMVGLVPV